MHAGVFIPVFLIIHFVVFIVICTILSINYSHQVKVRQNEVALYLVCRTLQVITL